MKYVGLLITLAVLVLMLVGCDSVQEHVFQPSASDAVGVALVDASDTHYVARVSWGARSTDVGLSARTEGPVHRLGITVSAVTDTALIAWVHYAVHGGTHAQRVVLSLTEELP